MYRVYLCSPDTVPSYLGSWLSLQAARDDAFARHADLDLASYVGGVYFTVINTYTLDVVYTTEWLGRRCDPI